MGAVGPYDWVAGGAKESGWVGEFGFLSWNRMVFDF